MPAANSDSIHLDIDNSDTSPLSLLFHKTVPELVRPGLSQRPYIIETMHSYTLPMLCIGAHVGHVHFMLFVSISFALGTQRKCVFSGIWSVSFIGVLA